MPTLKLRFPGGRYHATPWGHHVNEGLIEWPPSPWRLLRAVIACGFSSQGWDEVPPVACRLINKLAAVSPLYRLPNASSAHSRHYMPFIEGPKQKTTLVFDTWANIGDRELFINWPCELDEEEKDLLSKLASLLGYLGRSESWVEAQLMEGSLIEWNAVPCAENEHRGPGWEQVSLMGAIFPVEYEKWHTNQIEMALAPYPLPEGKKKITAKLQKEREKAVEPFPQNLISCLTKDTAWWKSHGWSQPPGSRRVLYWRQTDSLQVAPPLDKRRQISPKLQIMVLALSTPSGNRSALPGISRALPQAELFHRAVISRAGNGEHADCPELIGKDGDTGKPLQTNHSHAHTIPLDLGNDGRIDHILVYAPNGLGQIAQSAIKNLKRTWTKGGSGDIQLALAAQGSIEIIRDLQKAFNQPERIIGAEGGTLVWESATPFVPPRHMKTKGRNTLYGQVEAELESRGFPKPESVEVLPELGIRLRHFIRRRSKGGSLPPVDVGFALKLTFAKPVNGPILLGYASHFGLGRFKPVTP